MNIIEWLYLRQPGNLVYYDRLTGCYSRYYYDTVVKHKFQRESCYILFVDVNDLKRVNDTYGHCAGSELLTKVGSILRKETSKSSVVCRVGGDEFVIVSKTGEEETNLQGYKEFSVGSYKKEQYEDVSSAVAKADELMYKRKKALKYESREEIRKCN